MTLAFDLLMNIAVDVGDIVSLGHAPLGERRMVSILRGTFEGSGLRGEVLPGTAWQIVRKDKGLDIAARHALKEAGGGIVRALSQGSRYGPEDVLAAIARANRSTHPVTSFGP